VQANYELASDLEALIRDFVGYGEAKLKYQRLGEKLEIIDSTPLPRGLVIDASRTPVQPADRAGCSMLMMAERAEEADSRIFTPGA
jgi:hypothetical protein